MKKNSTKSLLTPRDKYLRAKFEITEAEYNAQLARQGGGCKICGKPPSGKALHVDHDHAVEKSKIISKRSLSGGWGAWPQLYPTAVLFGTGALKSVAIARVRRQLKRLSVRGILCWKCNTALKKFNDNPLLMQNSAEYILQYKEKLGKGLSGFE